MALEIFRLVGSVFVDTDAANKSLQNVDKKAEGLGKTLLNGIGTAAKWAAGIATAAGTVATVIGTKALESYAEYEQLVGGVETLFKDSADQVIKNAESAYRTAGINARDYMSTVTSFAASLLQSLGGDTVAAAEYADMAITDMSDNANKMGTTMALIQNAYQGFAKQNYTMLDNLKLGYGGTKEEMLRLLADADEINAKQGIITQYSIDNLSDVYEAIHVVQEELGIAGATALEATTTLEGGIKMIKSKLSDLFTKIGGAFAPVARYLITMVISGLPVIEGMVDRLLIVITAGAEDMVVWLDASIDRFQKLVGWVRENSDKIVEWTGYVVAAGVGVATFLLYLNWGNIMAAAGAALDLVTMAITKMNTAIKSNPIGLIISLIASLIAYMGYLYATNEEFRAFVDEMLAILWVKIKEFIAWFKVNVLPTIMEVVEWAQVNILPVVQEIIAWLQQTALPALLAFLTVVLDKLKDVVAWFKVNVIPAIQDVFAWVQANVVPRVQAVIAWLGETIGAFWAWLTTSFQSAGDSVGGIWETIKGFFQSAWDFIVGIWEACQPFFQGIWDGIILPVWGLIQEMIGAFQMAWDVIKLVWGYVEPYFSAIWEGIKIAVGILWTELSTGFKNAWEIIKLIWDMVGPYFITIWESIKAVFSVVATYLGGFFRTAWEAIKAVWSGVIAYFTMVWAGIKAVFAVVKGVLSGDFSDAWDAIKNLWDKAETFFNTVWTGIKNVFGSTKTWFGDTFKAAWEAVKNVFSNWGTFFGNLWTQIKDKFSAIGTHISDAISKSVKAGLNGVISSIEGIINTGINLINGAITLINNIPGVSIGYLQRLSLPRLEQGGVLEKGQVGLLEGNGAEAVVPLHNNKKWISAVAQDMGENGIGGNSAASEELLEAFYEFVAALPGILVDAFAQMRFGVNNREFARLVKEVG